MEKLSFWGSIGKSFELYFNNFGKIFLPFLWPYLWMLGAFAIYVCGFILTPLLISYRLGIVAGILILIAIVLFFAIMIKAYVRFIMLQPATAIVTKKLLLNNEAPDYKAALQEVRDDGWKLAKVILWEIPILLAYIIASVLIISQAFSSWGHGAAITPEKYLTLICVMGIVTILVALFQLSILFVSQFFAFRKDLSALACLVENFKMIGKHFLPVASIMLIWYIGRYIVGFIPGLGFLLSIAISICAPVLIMIPTYWYLRFAEINEEEEKGE